MIGCKRCALATAVPPNDIAPAILAVFVAIFKLADNKYKYLIIIEYVGYYYCKYI